jgi:hypothetical protein
MYLRVALFLCFLRISFGTLYAESPAPTRLYVCAHSFMVFTATRLPALADAARFPLHLSGRQMIGGSRVLQHWELPEAKAALKEGRVDVLTLSPHFQIPDEGIDWFTKLGLQKNPKLRVYVQASWPWADSMNPSNSQAFKNEERNAATSQGLRLLQTTQHTKWLAPLEAQIIELNKSVGTEAVHIIPVCDAVYTLRQRILEGRAPGLTRQTDLFRDDGGHAQPPLEALVTYCHFAAITGKSPAGLPVPKDLQAMPEAEGMNKLLQEIAWDTVSHYRLSGVSVETKEVRP